MSPLLAVDVDLVVTHARRIEAVVDDIAAAGEAARATNVTGGAFGVLCAFLVPAAATATAMAAGAIGSMEQMLARSAVEVRRAAADLSEFDDDARRAVAALERQLG